MNDTEFLNTFPTHIEQTFFLGFVFEILLVTIQEKEYNSNNFRSKIALIFDKKDKTILEKSFLLMIIKNYKNKSLKWMFADFLIQNFINNEFDYLIQNNYSLEEYISVFDVSITNYKMQSSFLIHLLSIMMDTNYAQRKELKTFINHINGNFLSYNEIQKNDEFEMIEKINQKFDILDLENFDSMVALKYFFKFKNLETLFGFKNKRIFNYITSYLHILPKFYNIDSNEETYLNIFKNIMEFNIISFYNSFTLNMASTKKESQLKKNILYHKFNLDFNEFMLPEIQNPYEKFELSSVSRNIPNIYYSKPKFHENLNKNNKKKEQNTNNKDLSSKYSKLIQDENLKNYLFESKPQMLDDYNLLKNEYNYKKEKFISIMDILERPPHVNGIINCIFQYQLLSDSSKNFLIKQFDTSINLLIYLFRDGYHIFNNKNLSNLLILKELYPKKFKDFQLNSILTKIQNLIRNFKTIEELQEWQENQIKKNGHKLIFTEFDYVNVDLTNKYLAVNLNHKNSNVLKTVNDYNDIGISTNQEFNKEYSLNDNQEDINEYLLANNLLGTEFIYKFGNKSNIFMNIENILQTNNIKYQAKVNKFPFVHDFKISMNNKTFYLNILCEDKCLLGSNKQLTLLETMKDNIYQNDIYWYNPELFNYSINFFDNDLIKELEKFSKK